MTENRHARAEEMLGTVGIEAREADSAESARANRAWWNADAEDYHRTHGEFLGASGAADFVWCPEGLREQDARLLGEPGDLSGRRILELGCGSAPCSRWLAEQGAHPVGLDVSEAMLGYARSASGALALVQADAEHLPFAPGSFAHACSAFGAVPFAASVAAVFTEVARVLKPGGRWVFAVSHPMRWAFPDVGGTAGLTVTQSYFDRTPYVEVDADGHATYVEHHRTLGDFVGAIAAAGLVLHRLVEPEWPPGFTREWGQWTPLRGALFPGTAIFCTHKPPDRLS